jgi:hypothetical protein
LQSYEHEQPDSTAKEYVRTDAKRKHATHAVDVRNGKPARREVLAALMELKKLWINAEQCLESARDAMRRSRRDYKSGGQLRGLMLREKKAKAIR